MKLNLSSALVELMGWTPANRSREETFELGTLSVSHFSEPRLLRRYNVSSGSLLEYIFSQLLFTDLLEVEPSLKVLCLVFSAQLHYFRTLEHVPFQGLFKLTGSLHS